MVAAYLALWTVLAPLPVPAAQALDSVTRVRLKAALTDVQDSLDRVRGAAYNFRTDLGGATPVVLHTRAQRMRASCLAATNALARLDSVLTASYPAGAPADLRRETRALRAALADCGREFDTATRWTERADSVRGWAPYRLRRLDEAMRDFSRVAVLRRR